MVRRRRERERLFVQGVPEPDRLHRPGVNWDQAVQEVAGMGTRHDRQHVDGKDLLNKAMDALGVPLEEPVASEVSGVLGPSGWTPGQHMKGSVFAGDPPGADSVLTRLSVVRYAPQAVKLDKAWTKGVPATAGRPSASTCSARLATRFPFSPAFGTGGRFVPSPA